MNANELADEVLYRFADSGGIFEHEPIMGKVYEMLRQQQAEIGMLKNQLGFIASINRAGLGVVSGTPMPSEKIEKIWNTIEEQKDDNFHYGWKKCEQYYGFSHPAKTLTDEEWDKAFNFYCETDEGVLKFDLELRDEWKKEQLIRWKEAIRKAQEK